MLLAST